MSKVAKIVDAAVHQPMQDVLAALMNRCMGACGLAEGTNAATIKTAAAVDFTIDGKMYTKAITDNIAITAGEVQSADTYRKYLVSIVAAGTVTVTGGVEAATSALALLPDLPADSAPLGYFEIQTVAVTYTPGTTDNSAAGITDTYQDMSCVLALD